LRAVSACGRSFGFVGAALSGLWTLSSVGGHGDIAGPLFGLWWAGCVALSVLLPAAVFWHAPRWAVCTVPRRLLVGWLSTALAMAFGPLTRWPALALVGDPVLALLGLRSGFGVIAMLFANPFALFVVMVVAAGPPALLAGLLHEWVGPVCAGAHPPSYRGGTLRSP
jgi:hypothetical protein